MIRAVVVLAIFVAFGGCDNCYKYDFDTKLECFDDLTCGYKTKKDGSKTETATGRKCQKWSMQRPHNHTNYATGYYDNKCRNPNSTTPERFGAWCFTLDKKERWEYCYPQCSQMKRDCPDVCKKAENYCNTPGDICSKCDRKCKKERNGIKCKILSVYNGKVSYDGGRVPGSYAVVKCNDGYKAAPRRTKCRKNGLWRNKKVSCKERNEIKCRRLYVYKGTVSYDGNRVPGSYAVVKCNDGYEAKPRKSVCRKNGLWRNEKLSCKAVVDICRSRCYIDSTLCNTDVACFGCSRCKKSCSECYDHRGFECKDFKCVCKKEYVPQGDRCQLNYCKNTPCPKNSHCSNIIGSYTCKCFDGFVNINTHTATALISPQCECPDGFHKVEGFNGDKCECKC